MNKNLEKKERFNSIGILGFIIALMFIYITYICDNNGLLIDEGGLLIFILICWILGLVLSLIGLFGIGVPRILAIVGVVISLIELIVFIFFIAYAEGLSHMGN